MNSFNVVVSCLQHEISGSCFLLNMSFPDKTRYNLLVDCGLFQEKKYQNLNSTLPNITPSNIDAVLITHDHCDHDGRLPFLVKSGYSNPIYVTKVTEQYLYKSLKISANISNPKGKKKSKSSEQSDTNTISITPSDVESTIKHVVSADYRNEVQLSENVYFTFYENGHMPGAAIIFVKVCYPGYENKYFLFSGDYDDKNILFDVKPLPEEVTHLPINIFMESTYGTHISEEIQPCFADNLVEAINNNCTVIEFCLSKNRIYQPFKIIDYLQKSKALSTKIPIYIDGPSLIYFFKKDCEIFKNSVIIPENVHFVNDQKERDMLLNDKSCKIVFTTSGMGSFGPAPAYIAKYVTHSDAMLHFNSFCVKGTLGDRLKNVDYGQAIPFKINNCGPLIRRAEIRWTAEFSKHAKFDVIKKFLKQFTNIQSIFIQHGELKEKQDSQIALIHTLKIPEKNVIIMKPDVNYNFCNSDIKSMYFTK